MPIADHDRPIPAAHYNRWWLTLWLLFALAAPQRLLAVTADPLQLPEVATAADTLQQRLRSALQFAVTAGATAPQQRAHWLAERPDDEAAWQQQLELLAGADLALAEDWLNLSDHYRHRYRIERALAASWLAYHASRNGAEQQAALQQLVRLLERQRGGVATVAWFDRLPAALLSPQLERQRQQLRAEYATRLLTFESEQDQPQPRLCLRFSGELADTQPLPLLDYLQLTPAIPISAHLAGERLCIDGLEHGQRYQITLRSGLLSARGERLPAAAPQSITIGHRDATVAFHSSSFLLPADHDPLLPVTSVNTAALDLTLYRIGSRNLHQWLPQIGQSVGSYDLDQIAERDGEALWQGSMALPAAAADQTQTTLIPLAQMVPTRRAGVYLLAAEVNGRRHNAGGGEGRRATQWLLISDLALNLFHGRDGITLFVRSFASAQPLAGVELRLLAHNNELLATATSDSSGLVHFADALLRGRGGNRPQSIHALASDGDFSFIDLESTALDLSERGVGGDAAPGPVTAFVTSERGIYRPGEAVHLTALLRRDSGTALANTPVTLKVQRSDGVEAWRTTSHGDPLGGHLFTIPLANAVPTGRWHAAIHLDPAAPPIGQTDFLVEDFVPERLALTLTPAAPHLAADTPLALQLSSRWLFGAPAADLAVSGTLRVDTDTAPFDNYRGWHFGDHEANFSARRVDLPPHRTDADGQANLLIEAPPLPPSRSPLAATLTITVGSLGDQPITRSVRLPLRQRRAEVGLKPRFSGGAIDADATALIDVVALDPTGTPLANHPLQLQWYRVERDWIAYWQSGTRWREVSRTLPIASSTTLLTTDATGRALIERPLPWGSYLLEVRDADGAVTTLPIDAGWQGSGQSDLPDALQLTLESSDLRRGEPLRAFIKAPFAGRALVTILRDRVLHHQELTLPATGTTIELPVAADWGPGAYLAVTAYRPRDGGQGARPQAPARAVGAAWFTVDKVAHQLQITFDAPPQTTPQQRFQLPFQISGHGDEPVHLVIAAVDEGVLGLTRFATPDPLEALFRQRQPGVDLHDLYGRLIAPADGQRGAPRSGGDSASAAAALSAITSRSREVVALFSGLLTSRVNGSGSVELPLPAFNGQLRLMAIAWSRGAVGAAEQSLQVREPLTADLLLPRFLNRGDHAIATLDLHNLDGAAGAYQIAISSDRPLASLKQTLSLATGERRQLSLPLSATERGVATLSLQIEGPDGYQQQRSWSLTLTEPLPITTERQLLPLAAGATMSIDATALAALRPEDAAFALTLSDHPIIAEPTLFDELQRYPYGCVEQTVSRALPLLYLPRLAARWQHNLKWSAQRTDEALRDAIGSLLARQRSDGGFGLWYAADSADLWLSAYATDFLRRANDAELPLPPLALQRALDYLEREADNNWNEDLAGRAYAFRVLAASGRAGGSALRHFATDHAAALPDQASRLLLAAALADSGERERASRLFALANQVVDSESAYHHYGSPLRDQAFAVTLLAESGLTAAAWEAAAALTPLRQQRQRLSTQELLWLLLAEVALQPSEDAPLTATLTPPLPLHETRGGAWRLTPDREQLEHGITLQNRGDKPLQLLLTRSGLPRQPLPAAAHGFTVTRQIYTLQGEQIEDLSRHPNEQLLVLLHGEVTDQRSHQALLIDRLPAGATINSTLTAAGDERLPPFLPPLQHPRYEARRDDRYVAALDLAAGERFAVAYRIQLTSAGTFHWPAPRIEDMYSPEQFARGIDTQLQVGAATESR